MKTEISELIDISKYYGSNKEYVIAGGGNTSFKDNDTIWIKASGQALSDLSEDGLVALSRQKLHAISTGRYSDDPAEREEQVKEDLFRSVTDQGKNKRPSVETSLHELIQYRFVVHLHPTLINGILCSRNAKNITLKLFGETVLFVPYTDPGYTLFKKLEADIIAYRGKFSHDPQIIFLENHGAFVGADTTGEIKRIYEEIIQKIKEQIPPVSDIVPQIGRAS
jgi:rhamnose utilization protein RhaD (predicted bifunctional aldolase and dehydrogenase)